MSTPNQRDLVIIGGGPAGYSAALYAARASLDTLVVEQGMPGGQIATSDMIDNYPGIERCSGAELGQKMQAHAESTTILESNDARVPNSDRKCRPMRNPPAHNRPTVQFNPLHAMKVDSPSQPTWIPLKPKALSSPRERRPVPATSQEKRCTGDEGYRIAPLATACFIVVNTCSSSAAATLPSRRRFIYRILLIR